MMGTLIPIGDAQRLVYRVVRMNSGRTDIVYNLFIALRSGSTSTRLAPGNAIVTQRVEPVPARPNALDWQSGGSISHHLYLNVR
jgi:hypothetical protein